MVLVESAYLIKDLPHNNTLYLQPQYIDVVVFPPDKKRFLVHILQHIFITLIAMILQVQETVIFSLKLFVLQM